MKVKRNCKYCKKIFYTKAYEIKRGHGIYCSKKCMGLSYSRKFQKICPICKKKFFTVPSKIKYKKGKYCSQKCGFIARRNRFTKLCKYCKQSFLIHPSDLKTGRGKYCSQKCFFMNKGFRPKQKLNITKETLSKEYYQNELSIKKIAIKFGLTKANVYYWMKKFGFKRRTLSETSSLEKNGAWMGGKSFEPYGLAFNKELKEQIRKRDNYMCQMCGISQSRDKLSIHHMDYNKQNNFPGNLISLCRSCHNKTNFNRLFWINKFKESKNEIINSISLLQ